MARLWNSYSKNTVCPFSSRVPFLGPWDCQEVLCETSCPGPHTVPEMADAFLTAEAQVKSTDIRGQNWNSEHFLQEYFQHWATAGRIFSLHIFVHMRSLAYLIVCHNYLYKCTYTSINQKGYLILLMKIFCQ